MKNEVLLRYKRARRHSVIRDSSIHRAGRGIRHCGLDPQSRGEGRGIQQDKTTTNISSPLMREESKSLSQCLTLGSEGEQDTTNQHPRPSLHVRRCLLVLSLSRIDPQCRSEIGDLVFVV